MSADAGVVECVSVPDGRVFFWLMEAMQQDDRRKGDSFYCNRTTLADAWKRDELWCAATNTADGAAAVTEHVGTQVTVFDGRGVVMTVLPVVLWVTPNDDAAQVVWTHSLFRRQGLARVLVRARKPVRAIDVIGWTAPQFWSALGYSEKEADSGIYVLE